MSQDFRDFIDLDILLAPDVELFSMVDKFKTDGISGDRVFRDRAVIADNFYNGYQWDNDTLETLRRERKPALTFNIIKKTVEFLVGTQEQNRKDIAVKPVKNGSNSVASILNKLVKDTITKNAGEHLMSEWFRQGCIKGRGFIHVYRDFELDPWTGDLKLELVDTIDVVIDPLSKRYDLSDSKYFIVIQYINRDEIIETYPQFKKELDNLRTDDESSHSSEEIFVDGGGDLNSSALDGEESRYSDRSQYRFRVQNTYILKTERRTHLLDKEEMTDTIINSKEAVEQFKQLEIQFPEKFKIVERADKILYLVKNINDIILERIKEPFKKEDDNDEFYRNPINMVPVIPFGARFDNGRWEGIIDDLIDPQREKNKLRSSILHIISGTASSGWVWEKGSLDDDTETALETNGSATNLNIKYQKGSDAPQKIPSNILPSGLFVLAEQSNQDINDISGVNAANLGVTTAQESGKANELRQIQGITTNTGIYDNFDKSMKLLGELIVGIIRSTELYTTQEIELIVEEFDIFSDKVMSEATKELNKKQPIPTLQELFVQAEAETQESQAIIQKQYEEVLKQRQIIIMQIAKQLTMGEIHNLYKGRYSIAIAQSNFSPTAKNANMNLLFEISALMPGIIPPEYLIKQTDLPDKDIILREIKRRQEAAQQAAINEQRTEVEGRILVQRAKNEGKINEANIKGRNDVVASRL